MSVITCPGVVVTDVTGQPTCQDMAAAPLAWTVAPAFSIDALDPLMLSGAFAAGFALYATAWAIGKGFAVVLSMLK